MANLNVFHSNNDNRAVIYNFIPRTLTKAAETNGQVCAIRSQGGEYEV